MKIRSLGQRSRSTSRSPAPCSSASAFRSGGVTCVDSVKSAGSHTSASVGAMFMSPATTLVAGAVTDSRNAASHSSLYA